jgi:hypothetical protein
LRSVGRASAVAPRPEAVGIAVNLDQAGIDLVFAGLSDQGPSTCHKQVLGLFFRARAVRRRAWQSLAISAKDTVITLHRNEI